MNRRRLLACLGAALAGRALPSRGQPQWRIAFVFVGSRDAAMQTRRFTPFLDGMRTLGYVEGRDYALEARFLDGDATRYASIVSEVVAAKPDVIVATGSPLHPLLRKAAGATPVVVTVSPDPVVEGIAESLARPGRNFTGLTTSAPATTLKHIELLKALRPRLSRYAVLSNPIGGHHSQQVANHREAAKKIGLSLIAVSAGDPPAVDRAFGDLKAAAAEGVIVLGDTFFLQQRDQIVARARSHELPSVFNVREFAEAGGLASYGVDVPHNTRRAADFVHRILRGAKPGELPFEQPSKFDFVINMKTAKALGISVPPAMLISADRVIE